ncbi:hypothetical protein [Streptomyces sp. NPDC088400]|uniref:hypothetical protein n=1 Tax=Streptomyces sp. NPDC088400 TaxID=3365861 RepID=UPI003813E77B
MRVLLTALVSGVASATLLLGVVSPAGADTSARGWKAHMQCTKWRISDSTAHGFVQAHGIGLTQNQAWTAAQKDANRQMPRGYRAKHCTKKSIKKLR